MSEQVENLDKNITDKRANVHEVYLLLHSLEIGAIDFRGFLDKAVKWSNQVRDTEEQKETTLAEE